MTLRRRIRSRLLHLHDRVYRGSRGLLGHHLIGVPTLVLRTTGRRTGRTREHSLVYAREGASFLLVASNSGLDQPPAWLRNLEANPEVDLLVGWRRVHGVALPTSPGSPDFERLWALVNENNHHRYEGMQARTARPIPVVVVRPTAS